MSGAETQRGEDLGTFQATTLDDFHDIEAKLKDPEERRTRNAAMRRNQVFNASTKY